MLYLFLGTDTHKARERLHAVLAKDAKGKEVVRITDAHTFPDFLAAIGGGGMFALPRAVVFDGVLESDEMRERLLAELPQLAKETEVYYMIEGAPDASTKKFLEKYAERVEKFDAPKKGKDGDFFALGNALRRGKKKDLWVLMQEEFVKGKAPEAVHGSLFWAAKQMYLRAPSERAKNIVAGLAELTHEERRRGIELEYALEHFALTIA